MHLWEEEVTLDEITEALTMDHRPAGPDGCSNIDRLAFVSQVFGLETIDLSIRYDFTSIIEEDNPIMVAAAKHLALLKLDYLNRLYEHYHMAKSDYDSFAAMLILDVRRIDHHLSYLEEGLPTPPFSAFL